MSAYLLTVISRFGAIICLYIAIKRKVKQTFIGIFVVVLLGSLAIPLVMFAKQEKSRDIEN